MKKILTLACAALFMVSCGEDPADKMCKIIDDGTARIEKCANSDEAEKIQKEVMDQITEFGENAGIIDNLRFGEEGQKRVEEATEKMMKAYMDKVFNSATESLDKIGEDAKKAVEDAAAAATE